MLGQRFHMQSSSLVSAAFFLCKNGAVIGKVLVTLFQSYIHTKLCKILPTVGRIIPHAYHRSKTSVGKPLKNENQN